MTFASLARNLSFFGAGFALLATATPALPQDGNDGRTVVGHLLPGADRVPDRQYPEAGQGHATTQPWWQCHLLPPRQTASLR